MKSSPRMRQIVEQLAARHQIDLSGAGAALRLEMAGFDPLCTRRVGPQLVSVAHQFEVQGVLLPNLEVLFFVKACGDWCAIAITLPVGEQHIYAQLNENGTKVLRYDTVCQAQLADLADLWAENIQEQGWFERGTLHIDLARRLTEQPLFALGQIVATFGALQALEEANQLPQEFLTRHVQGDWEILDPHDRQMNKVALKEGRRIFSVYETKLGIRVWLITEWDRSLTTLLLPQEY